MTRFVVGTESVEESERIASYLAGRATAGDEVLVVNAIEDGADDTDVVQAGERALDALADSLSRPAVETHQLIRGNAPADELLAFVDEHDADEVVLGVHKRSPAGKAIFGSTAQSVLLNTPVPVVAIPLPG